MKNESKNIYQAKCNNYYIINSIPGAPLLQSLGIAPNMRVYKKYAYGLGGPVLLEVDMSQIAIGKDLAKQIVVSEE